MRLSARNQLLARVTDIDAGRVNGTVRLELTCGGGISANISMKAIEWMQLVPDKTVYAVIKATEVMIAAEPVKISARNRIAGTIADISNGAVQRYGPSGHREGAADFFHDFDGVDSRVGSARRNGSFCCL